MHRLRKNLKRNHAVVHEFENVSPGFVQGFECHDEGFLVSLGLYGSSALQLLDAKGHILKNRPLAADYFAEGCTWLNGKIYQCSAFGRTL